VSRVDYFNDPDAPGANCIVPSVCAVISDDTGAILMVHRTDNDLWALPGGGIDIGESAAEAVVREVIEETGLRTKADRLTGIYTNPRHVIAYDDGEVRQQFALCFAATVLGGELHTSSETSEVRFIPEVELDQYDVHPSTRLRIAHRDLGQSSPAHIG
jgi:ADP-ribose pyrophosphatase YjhB (NUDIX family)